MDILLNEISVQSGKKPPNDHVSRVPWVPEVGVEIGRGFVEKKQIGFFKLTFLGGFSYLQDLRAVKTTVKTHRIGS